MSDSPQYNKVYDINSLFAEMFSFLFLMLTRLQCLLMALNVTMDTCSVTNGYSQCWKIMFVKCNYLNFHIAKSVLYIMLKFVQLCLLKQYKAPLSYVLFM